MSGNTIYRETEILADQGKDEQTRFRCQNGPTRSRWCSWWWNKPI